MLDPVQPNPVNPPGDVPGGAGFHEPLPPPPRPGCAGPLFLVLLIAMAGWFLIERPACRPACEPAPEAPPEPPAPRVWPLAGLQFPTVRTNLLDLTATEIFMPTAAGRFESALYGSTRTGRDGRPSFHEGVDIAPLERDRHGKPLDEVRALAEGRVGYINRHAGNSNYGIYVVLFHEDAVGEIFTLYAHLASVEHGLVKGQAVRGGAVLGRLGNTPASIIPMARAHLHLEIGTVLNARFAEWLVREKQDAHHGAGHGWNLLGLDPLPVFAGQQVAGEAFSLGAHLATVPVAVELLVRTARLPDYFRRYASLWQGGGYAGPVLVVALSEGGVPLRGRAATVEEGAVLGNAQATVLRVTPGVLGGNGRRLVRLQSGEWRLSESGRKWVEWFLF